MPFCHKGYVISCRLTKTSDVSRIIFKRMNVMAKQKDKYDSQVKLFKVLMHPARLAVLDVLRRGEACVCHMEAALGYRQAYLSQQLMVLREAGLVDDQRDGWNVYYRVSKPDIFNVIDAARQALGESKRVSVPVMISSCSCPHCTGEKTNTVTAAARPV
jgi:DNA-binding transcriptional ArsR family regulator